MKIIGLKKIDIKVIKNKKGDILKFLSSKSIFYKRFGEIYFSEINKGETKGWNLHKKYTCCLSVISGNVIFDFLDYRKKSKSFLKKDRIILSKKNYGIIIIPSNIWFRFTTKVSNSLIVNALNYPHLKSETKKIKDLAKII